MNAALLLSGRRLAGLALAGAAALLTACASLPADPPATVTAEAGAAAAPVAPLLTVPPASVGVWVDLGYYLAPWLAGDAPVPVTGATAPTRVAGLRGDDGRWLAIVLVQTAPAGSAPCPFHTSLHASDARYDNCLRMRRNTDFDHWLHQQHSVLHRWLQGREWTVEPRAWVGYRVPDTGGSALEVHALIHPSLIEPSTRNNADFLAGGWHGEQWARQLAAAARTASASTPLAVPPFPFGPHVAPSLPTPTAVTPPPAPAAGLATQLAPKPEPRSPAPAPRVDRE